MSSISDPHKIHRHSQEHTIEHNVIGGIPEKQFIYQDGILVSPAPDSADFASGVTPASVEAAVRAAPSPNIPQRSRGRTSCRGSWGSSVEVNHPIGSPRPSYKGGLTPFSSFKSVPTNEADYQAWRKSQTTKRNQRMSSTAPISHVNQSSPLLLNFDGRNNDPIHSHHRIPPNIPNSRNHLHHPPPSHYFPTEANQRKQEVEAICLDLLRRFQQACRYALKIIHYTAGC